MDTTMLLTHTYRWMNAWNISLGSEAKQRSIAKELIGPNLKVESAAFTFVIDGGTGGEEVLKAPLAYVPDLVAKVKQLLDQNDR